MTKEQLRYSLQKLLDEYNHLPPQEQLEVLEECTEQLKGEIIRSNRT